MATPRRLGTVEVALFAIVAILGLRWVAVAAASGVASLPLWALAFALFHVPLSLGVGELSSRFEGDGSVYEWVRGTLGPFAGFICAWFYWISFSRTSRASSTSSPASS